MNETLDARLCKEAITVQDACNLSGVAHSLVDVVARIRDAGGGSVTVRKHPAVQLFVMKLADLCGIDYSSGDFSRAYQACRERAARVEGQPA